MNRGLRRINLSQDNLPNQVKLCFNQIYVAEGNYITYEITRFLIFLCLVYSSW